MNIINVLHPPVMIGDTIYRKGHGNRKKPEEWQVCYLGWNGGWWDITVSRYENNVFIGTSRFAEDVLNRYFWFTSAQACQEAINKRSAKATLQEEDN